MSTAQWQARRLPISAAWLVRSSAAARSWAIIRAGQARILLTGAYLIAGILRPAFLLTGAHDHQRDGRTGRNRPWVMTGRIFLTGGCYLVTIAGLTGARASAR